MKRGDVYWAELKPRSGSEQKGRGPVIIMSNDGFNAIPTWRSVIVIPLSTSERQSLRGPTAIAIPKGEAGLKEDSIALCHQLTTLDRSKLGKHMGSLSETFITGVEEGLKAAVDL